MCVKLSGGLRPGKIQGYSTKYGNGAGVWGFNNGSQYNVRLESINTIWQKYKENRGILQVEYFMEKDKKFIHTEGKTLNLGVLYNDMGEFSVITTEVGETVKPYHHRMPLIITDEQCVSFLEGKTIVTLPDTSLTAI